MAIDFQHKDYKANIDRWELAENICEAKDTEQYLIELNPTDKTIENVARNKAYRERAVLYPVAGHTMQGLVGLLFSKDPKLTVPPALEYVADNIDGTGVSIDQQAQDLAEDLLTKARGGLYVTYPKTEGPVSVADMNSGNIRATIHEIEADQITNWRTQMVGSNIVLTLLVIKECVEEVQSDGYEVKEIDQYRELALENGYFIVRTWRKPEDSDEWVEYETFVPLDSQGNPWNEIPFVPVGAISNTMEVDEAPMYTMAKINVAHYRNSADYEDSVWYAGQAQPWMSGIDQTHINLMKDNDMYVGSRNLLGVPSGEQFGFASAQPNSMVREAMMDKLHMMIGLGARFIQGSGPAKTATESENDARAEYSSLALISKNIAEAYGKALAFAARFMGTDGEISYELTDDFVNPSATAQEIQAMVAGFIQGAVPLDEYFRWLKKVDIVDSETTLEEFGNRLQTPQSMPDLNVNG